MVLNINAICRLVSMLQIKEQTKCNNYSQNDLVQGQKVHSIILKLLYLSLLFIKK